MRVQEFILPILFGIAYAVNTPPKEQQQVGVAPEAVSTDPQPDTNPSLRPQTTPSSSSDALSIAGWYVTFYLI